MKRFLIKTLLWLLPSDLFIVSKKELYELSVRRQKDDLAGIKWVFLKIAEEYRQGKISDGYVFMLQYDLDHFFRNHPTVGYEVFLHWLKKNKKKINCDPLVEAVEVFLTFKKSEAV